MADAPDLGNLILASITDDCALGIFAQDIGEATRATRLGGTPRSEITISWDGRLSVHY